jgi:hypothetical protein
VTTLPGQHPATAGHGRSAADACSVLSDLDGTSAFGTAAPARFFVVLEQNGPWGRVAARQSHLDPGLGGDLETRCTRLGGRFMLMRRPSGHPDQPHPRQVLVAWTGGGRPAEAWLLLAELGHAGDLVGLDWDALASGDRPAVAASLPGSVTAPPALLVCTNGRRDVCCAVRGRPLAAAAHTLSPDRVWEVSHTGGHRFSPTAVLLPWGQNYARLDDASTAELLTTSAGGHTPATLFGPLHDRGRSGIPSAEACAESFVRGLTDETSLSAFTTRPASAGIGRDTDGVATGAVEVVHADGRRWLVHVERVASGPVRPGSCAAKAFPVVEHRARLVDGP